MAAHPARAGRAPTVEIVEEPAEECRFRYEQESRTNGSILGANSSTMTDAHNAHTKTYPTIRIKNYVGPVEIYVSCVTKDPPYRPHPHKIVGRLHCTDGVCKIITNITELNPTVEFRNIGIQCTKRNKVTEVLQQREVDPFGTGFDSRTYSSISLHHIRLAFQVFVEDAAGLCTVPLASVPSRVITDQRRLCVVNCSQCSGVATGGTQITLLTEKLTRGVTVHFFEESTGWQAPANILRTHYMYAMVIETPPYRDPTIREPVNVSYYLSRPPSGDATLDRSCTSEPRQFTYTPTTTDRMDMVKYKRPHPMLLRPNLEVLAPKRPNYRETRNLQNETINSPVTNTTNPFFLEIPPSYGQQQQDRESALAVAGPSTHDPLDWLQVNLIYPELRRPTTPTHTPPFQTPRKHPPMSQSHDLGMQIGPESPGLNQPTTGQLSPMTQPASSQTLLNQSPMSQSHGRGGQIGYESPGQPTMGQPSPVTHPASFQTPRKYPPMSQSHGLGGHESPGLNQPTMGQPSPMTHPASSQTPLKYPPMSQSYGLGGQIAHESLGLNQPPTMGQSSPVTHPASFQTPTKYPPMSQSHYLGGQIGHESPGQPTLGQHSPMTHPASFQTPRKYPPMSQSHGLGGQIGHESPGLNQPTMGQPPMTHPVSSQTPLKYPPMSQSYGLGGQIAHESLGLNQLTMGQSSPMTQPASTQTSKKRLPMSQSHGPLWQIGHPPMSPGRTDYCPGLDHGAQFGQNELDESMCHTTSIEPQELHHQEENQEMDQNSFDLAEAALASLLDTQSTGPPSCEFMSLSSLEEEIRVNLSGSMSRLATTNSQGSD